MKEKNYCASNGTALGANTLGALCVESFLNENYCFRRNELSGKVEFAILAGDGVEPADSDAQESPIIFRPLTQEALNSIILRAIREGVCEKGSPKTAIELYVRSEEVPQYNPIREYLEHLPQWDGRNHVATLFNRLPGVSSE